MNRIFPSNSIGEIKGLSWLTFDRKGIRRKNQLWSKEHKDAVLGDLRETPGHIKQVFFVSPPGVLRTNFSTDRRMSSLSKNLFKLRRHIEKTKPWYVIQNWKRYLIISTLLILGPLLLTCLLNYGFCEKMPSGVFCILYKFFISVLPRCWSSFALVGCDFNHSRSSGENAASAGSKR